MLDFKIDAEKCTECGLCVKECPVGIIEMDGLPTIKSEKEAQCMKCQHCLAVCPTGALSILGKDPEDSIPTPRELPDAKLLKDMMKTRRSIRKYKKEALDPAFIYDLLKTASYAPTGHNDNGVHFTVIEDAETMTKLRDMSYASIKQAGENGEIVGPMSFIYDFQKLWELYGQDIIFRGAPHLVIASVPNNHISPVEDAMIALSYFEILANANGIGTQWNGLVKYAINDVNPDLRDMLGIPEDHKIGYVMLFGKPATKYKRSIQSDGVHISSAKL